jgi:hypothetical protein
MPYRQALGESREEYERTKPKPTNAIVQEGDDTSNAADEHCHRTT